MSEKLLQKIVRKNDYMIYPFVKKFLPILGIAIIIYVIIFIAYVGMFQISSLMIERQAHELRLQSTNDVDFANNVRIWVWNRVSTKGNYQNGYMINPPELSYLSGVGDCSERSLLMVKMLQSEGIESHTIYGVVNDGEYHQSVEYTVNGTIRIIDQEQFPSFIKRGNGIQAIEYEYDVFWFIPWRSYNNNIYNTWRGK
jgi:hypothetical protein